MEIEKLEKDYRHLNLNDYNSNTYKYQLNCNTKNILEQIKHFDKFLVDNQKVLTEELFVITAYLRDNLVKTKIKPQIVIKMSSNLEIIHKDYHINMKIKEIEGFIKYDCIFECFDNTKTRIINEIKRKNNYNETNMFLKSRDHYNKNIKVDEIQIDNICSSNSTNGKLFNVIIMPFIKSKTLGKKQWTNTEVDKSKLRSLYKQILVAYILAFNKSKFIHRDNHLDNFLMKRTNKEKLTYTLNDRDIIEIETYGIQIIIMDFDKSMDEEFNPFNLDDSGLFNEFLINIYNLFNKQFSYITVDNSDIQKYIMSLIKNNKKSLDNVIELLNLIDNIDYIVNPIENIT